MPPADDDAPIFLIGFMASGKTTVGRLLAERLDWAFVDLDKVIEDGGREDGRGDLRGGGGGGVPEARDRGGARGGAERRKTVVATGGGAPCREENLEAMLAAGRVFWLDVSAEEAVAARGQGSGRPLLDGAADPVAAARKLLDARRPFYERAHERLDTEGPRRPGEVAKMLQSCSSGHGCWEAGRDAASDE